VYPHQVVGEVATGDETVALATSLQPNVILMDIKLPGLNGIAATREILAANPKSGF
jgi:DNA-binding NarL/FixJ family response regulator